MIIRRAKPEDMPDIVRLLEQVQDIHHKGRPDLFKAGARKFADEQLKDIICDDGRPVFVAEDAAKTVRGYVFCIKIQKPDDNILTDIKTIYIDDLCVDAEARGQHIGRQLYEYVLDYAKREGCYNVTLNVWACNTSAIKFYQSCGLVPQKIGMEKIL